uniref:Uncharacterized protein n=1 Tax=Gasterosteus aculeatus TaxID=69293 RepID=G3Q0J9_GASAC
MFLFYCSDKKRTHLFNCDKYVKRFFFFLHGIFSSAYQVSLKTKNLLNRIMYNKYCTCMQINRQCVFYHCKLNRMQYYTVYLRLFAYI